MRVAVNVRIWGLKMLFFVVIGSKRSRPIQSDIKVISLSHWVTDYDITRQNRAYDQRIKTRLLLRLLSWRDTIMLGILVIVSINAEPFALVTRGEHEKIGILDGLISCSKYKNIVFYTLMIEHILTRYIDLHTSMISFARPLWLDRGLGEIRQSQKRLFWASAEGWQFFTHALSPHFTKSDFKL